MNEKVFEVAKKSSMRLIQNIHNLILNGVCEKHELQCELKQQRFVNKQGKYDFTTCSQAYDI